MVALRLGIVMGAGLVALAAAPAERPAPAAPYAEATAPADTLRATVRAGQTLIVGLPARVDGAEASYELVRAPALSWLVDRSFMWRTLERERGTLPVLLRRTRPGAEPETVTLLVEIEP